MTKIIKIEGVDEMMKTLLKADSKIAKNATTAVKNNVEKGAAIARRYAPKPGPAHPYATGNLVENIVTKHEGKNSIIHSRAPYSGYQEYGTRYQSGTSFMRPMLKEVVPMLLKDLEDVARGAFK